MAVNAFLSSLEEHMLENVGFDTEGLVQLLIFPNVIFIGLDMRHHNALLQVELHTCETPKASIWGMWSRNK